MAWETYVYTKPSQHSLAAYSKAAHRVMLVMTPAPLSHTSLLRQVGVRAHTHTYTGLLTACTGCPDAASASTYNTFLN